MEYRRWAASVGDGVGRLSQGVLVESEGRGAGESVEEFRQCVVNFVHVLGGVAFFLELVGEVFQLDQRIVDVVGVFERNGASLRGIWC